MRGGSEPSSLPHLHVSCGTIKARYNSGDEDGAWKSATPRPEYAPTAHKLLLHIFNLHRSEPKRSLYYPSNQVSNTTSLHYIFRVQDHPRQPTSSFRSHRLTAASGILRALRPLWGFWSKKLPRTVSAFPTRFTNSSLLRPTEHILRTLAALRTGASRWIIIGATITTGHGALVQFVQVFVCSYLGWGKMLLKKNGEELNLCLCECCSFDTELTSKDEV